MPLKSIFCHRWQHCLHFYGDNIPLCLYASLICLSVFTPMPYCFDDYGNTAFIFMAITFHCVCMLHWSACLFLHQCHTVLMIIVGNQGAWCFHLCPFLRLLGIFGVFSGFTQILGLFYFNEKCHWNFHRNCIESLHSFEEFGHFVNSNPSNPWAWNIFPFVSVFNIFH